MKVEDSSCASNRNKISLEYNECYRAKLSFVQSICLPLQFGW